VKADRTLNYEDGSAKMTGVRISVRKGNGRDFIVTAREASAGKDRKDLVLKGSVVLEASDGFRLTTEDATYTEALGLVRAPGRVAFTKGGLSGSGLGMTYDRTNDVLTLLAEPDVTMAGRDEVPGTSFTAGSAVLDRVMDVLALSGEAKVRRQTFDASVITVRLSEDEQFVRLVELRGDAGCGGGGARRDVCPGHRHHLPPGRRHHRSCHADRAGAAAVRARAAPNTGRRRARHAAGSGGALMRPGGGIRFDHPSASARASIQARPSTRTCRRGAPSATFVDDVQFPGRAQAPRVCVAHAGRLDGHDEVSSATFRGAVAFEDRGLAACAAQGAL
jgi:hypothetical protein